MRYPVNKGELKQVPLPDELSFMKDYLALQQLRLGEDYPILFEQRGDIESMLIMPLSLMPLVENAFKHGISIRHKTPIHIALSVEDGDIRLEVRNQLLSDQMVDSLKTGIENLKARLKIMMPQRHSLTFKEEDAYFVANLEMNAGER